jgi:protein TonB
MEISTILTADVLDILFEGRNKEYGAYDLRRTYNRRLTVSITVMLSVVFLLFIGFAFAGKKKALDPDLFRKDIVLTDVKPPAEKPKEQLVLPPKPPAAQVPVQTLKVTPPRIVPDEQVPKDEMPPVETQENVKIGTITQNGIPDEGLVTGPVSEGVKGGVIELPKKEEDDPTKIWMKVEIESMYPGGPAAWERFLRKNLHFPDEAADAGVSGTVIVQFIVDRDGNVSNVEAISGPQELRAEAVRVIKKSGQWTPAVQNGIKVRSYKKQPLGFQLGE